MEPVNVNLRGDGREWNLIAGEKSKLSTRSTRHAYHVGILQAKTNGRSTGMPILSVVSTNISTSSLS